MVLHYLSERLQKALDAMGIKLLWEHFLKACARASLSYLYHTSSTSAPNVDPPHLHNPDYGYTKSPPQHTHRLLELHIFDVKYVNV